MNQRESNALNADTDMYSFGDNGEELDSSSYHRPPLEVVHVHYLRLDHHKVRHMKRHSNEFCRTLKPKSPSPLDPVVDTFPKEREGSLVSCHHPPLGVIYVPHFPMDEIKVYYRRERRQGNRCGREDHAEETEYNRLNRSMGDLSQLPIFKAETTIDEQSKWVGDDSNLDRLNKSTSDLKSERSVDLYCGSTLQPSYKRSKHRFL